MWTGTSDFKSSWFQFVYQNAPGGSSYLLFQYVLIGSIPAKSGCTGISSMSGISWSVNSGQPSDCYGFSPEVSVGSSFVSAPLTDLLLEASANLSGSGMDELTLCGTPSSMLGCSGTLSMPDGVLDLAAAWYAAEFNVFGDAGGSEAYFNTGATITVADNLTDESGTPIAPGCASYSATGETNDLFLGPCSTTNSGILFTEGSLVYSVSVSPAAQTVLSGQTTDFSVTATLLNGTAEPLTLTLDPILPSGSSYGFGSLGVSTVTLTPSGGIYPSSTLVVSTVQGGGLGDFPFTVESQVRRPDQHERRRSARLRFQRRRQPS